MYSSNTQSTIVLKWTIFSALYQPARTGWVNGHPSRIQHRNINAFDSPHVPHEQTPAAGKCKKLNHM